MTPRRGLRLCFRRQCIPCVVCRAPFSVATAIAHTCAPIEAHAHTSSVPHTSRSMASHLLLNGHASNRHILITTSLYICARHAQGTVTLGRQGGAALSEGIIQMRHVCNCRAKAQP